MGRCAVTEQQPDLLTALYTVYPEAAVLMQPDTAHMVVEGHRLMSRQSIPGVDIQTEEADEAITIRIRII